jgi:hypothetical protein
VAGRSFRGRTYLAGFPNNAFVNGFIDASAANDVTNAYDAIDGLINAAGGTWGVVSKYHGYTQSPPKYKKVPTPRAEGIFTDIIDNSTDNKPDSQRRRLVGRGS